MNYPNEINHKDCMPCLRRSKNKYNSKIINECLKSRKTVWPIPQIVQVFLPDFKIKSQINEYSFEIVELISNGAFGKVYRVKRLNSNSELYAMKMLEKSSVISGYGIKQVKDEVKIQSICGHHPFIVNCPFFWQNRNTIFIVSDFVGGGELLKLLQNHGPLPEELCRIYFAELIIIIDFLHNAGIIYRDIKPENILLDEYGHLQLIDFGLAKWLSHGCRTSTICGTTQYMAPEIFQSKPYNHVVDWWSAGVLLFQMLTNQVYSREHSVCFFRWYINTK
ncbi:serine/threonine-protein kinase S6KL isoform X2 [Sipha flava]|uniref:Serine/threonine-protein kinase S6KL isoform X2 n=1 Tax=Sipha flava TaxID=143950 RepID=A0A8B8GDM6_9HEMI|nr:serine/threonine-protein kinase S6KL isoform X2 [Sipha flava]